MASEAGASAGGPVLVGWDGSERSRDALVLAGVIARERSLPVRVALAYLSRDHLPRALGARLEEDARARIADAPLELLGDVERETAPAPGGSPAQALHREAERCGAAMVVLGSTHRGPLGRVAPGSVAEHLLHGAPCAVAVAPGGYAGESEHRLRVIAVAYDGSRHSRAAVDWAVELGQQADATLKVISVVVPLGTPFAFGGAAYYYLEADESAHEQTRRALTDLVAGLPGRLRAQDRLRKGNAAEEIVAECSANADLLVVGSRGYGAVRRALLGSVSAELIRSAPCPVVVVPQTDEGRAAPDREPESLTAAG